MAPRKRSLAERLWPRVDRRGPDECWPWTGGRNSHGYGTITDEDGRTIGVHVAAWSLTYGPVPPERQVDHACHGADLACRGGSACLHRRCANPAHLESVPPLENYRRGGGPGGRKFRHPERCRNGHPLEGDNLYVSPKGSRGCRACRSVQAAAAGRRYRERMALR